MSRRNRSRRAPLAANLFPKILGLAAGRPQFTATRYTVDGVTSKVGAFVDWNDATHTLAQATSAQQVAIPAAHANFAGAVCATFAGGQNYVSNRAAAAWTYEHDGISSEVFFVLAPTAGAVQFFCASASSAAVAGFHLYDDGNYRHHLSNEAAGAVVNGVLLGAPALNTATYLDIRHKAADANQFEMRNRGTLTANGTYGATPFAGAASIPFELGARNGAAFSSMRWAYLGFFPALTAGERAIVQRWIQQTYGIAA